MSSRLRKNELFPRKTAVFPEKPLFFQKNLWSQDIMTAIDVSRPIPDKLLPPEIMSSSATDSESKMLFSLIYS